MDENKDSRPLFQGIDEFERTYAPEELPPDDPEAKRARIEGETETDTVDTSESVEPAIPAPIAAIGTSPSGQMAPPNIGRERRDRAPGEPDPQARYPISDEESSDDDLR